MKQLLLGINYQFDADGNRDILHPDECPTKLLEQLMCFLRPALHEFVQSVMQSEAGVKFKILPASQTHHHNFEGGLLAHSLECALMAGQTAFTWLSQSEAELTLVAALLHDIGKCRTYEIKGGYSMLGQHVRHESVTLEILAPHLEVLNKSWADGANLLRVMLTEDKQYSRFPEFPGCLLIKSADHFSTATNRRNSLFSARPNFHYFAYDKQYKQKYLRNI